MNAAMDCQRAREIRRRGIALTLVLGLSFTATLTYAQAVPSSRRFEIGLQMCGMNFGDFDPLAEQLRRTAGSTVPPPDRFNESGFGTFLSFSAAQHLSIEARWTFFPFGTSTGGKDDRFYQGGRKSQYLFGVNVGGRRGGLGMFGGVHPGLTQFEAFPTLISAPASQGASLFAFGIGSRNFFSVNVSGLLEADVSPRMVIRVRGGDTLVVHRGLEGYRDLNPTFARHSFSSRVVWDSDSDRGLMRDPVLERAL